MTGVTVIAHKDNSKKALFVRIQRPYRRLTQINDANFFSNYASNCRVSCIMSPKPAQQISSPGDKTMPRTQYPAIRYRLFFELRELLFPSRPFWAWNLGGATR